MEDRVDGFLERLGIGSLLLDWLSSRNDDYDFLGRTTKGEVISGLAVESRLDGKKKNQYVTINHQ